MDAEPEFNSRSCYDFQMKPMNIGFKVINNSGLTLTDVNFDDVNRCNAVLLRGFKIRDTGEFHTFCKQFGKPLEYGDSIEKAYEGETITEDELHYDGISSKNPSGVPTWVIFYLQKALNPKEGGRFLVVDSVGILNKLSSDVIDFLHSHKQEFYGYQLYNSPKVNPNELIFSIDTITKYKNTNRLRIHLPSKKTSELAKNGKFIYSRAYDFLTKFEGCSGIESKEIFDEIRHKLESEELKWEITFEDSDILIVNNQYSFHGRLGLKNKSFRIMRRIQLLEL